MGTSLVSWHNLNKQYNWVLVFHWRIHISIKKNQFVNEIRCFTSTKTVKCGLNNNKTNGVTYCWFGTVIAESMQRNKEYSTSF